MNLRRVRPWDWAAALAGIALQAVLAARWYERDGAGLSGWTAFAITDVLVAVSALAAILLPLVVARSTGPVPALAWSVLASAVTFLVLLVVLYRVVNAPGDDGATGVSAGAWLGLLLVAAQLYAIYRSMRDQRMPGVPGASAPERMPAPR